MILIMNHTISALSGVLNLPKLFILPIYEGVPRRQSHRRSGLPNLPSVGAIP